MIKGFDNEKYITLQSENIRERINRFGGRLYLEFGGKLFDDYHAARVLPGFDPDSKVKMLLQLKDQIEIVIAINVSDIERNKVRGDLGITYDLDVLRLIDAFRTNGFLVGSVVLTQYASQPAADTFQKHLEMLGVQVYRHYYIEGYPSNVNAIVSESGYGKNDYIEVERPLVVVTAPGPVSGKMSVCLSQLFHDYIRGIDAGYAKFETFPIWNLPVMHPINLAYEAATADLRDVNMIDPFHLSTYGEQATSYNRDVELFPVLAELMRRILKVDVYKSPTDMGVNMAGYCMLDEHVIIKAAQQEIIRRYYTALCNHRKGLVSDDEVYKVELLMKQANLSSDLRPVIAASLKKEAATDGPAVAIQLHTGQIVTGKDSALLGSSSALLLNALKTLAGISDEIHLLSPIVIEPLQNLKVTHLGGSNPRLHTDEVLVALAISAPTNPMAELVLKSLKELRGCEAHSTVILSSVDENIFRKLGVNLTCEPKYQTSKLYHGI
ncbi:MAG: DUF1846 domain-containing protein [Oscillospiraceae bacterium]|nr:DUF1846 domain-containing protein [Oscillospiraceae bacterium]